MADETVELPSMSVPVVRVRSLEAAEHPPPGQSALITRPLRRSDLRDACRTALGTPIPGAPPQRAAANRRHVLVAEDNPVNQRVVLAMLGRLGCRTVVVGNGRAAVEAWAEKDFDLVLMDCHMPEMDGYSATREIRRREGPGERTLIIALTASAMEGDRRRCLDAGMDDYLPKPLRLDALAKVLS